ncbi:hypothetical protein [Parasedimentitalea maritima]|uniref:Uncharacterized protein n=1 Tax=Parasedimentitalea maritima TaxID=2578117 RepID=A0A6A4RKJ6_9RHOB|nr:hypothetical protein [Zongyanglinia marina]KAE9630184.1 hypothetical protein GP644_10950 [Zongyanglinia marina]
MKKLFSTHFSCFIMIIVFIFLLFTLPKLFSSFLNPIFLAVVCLMGIFYSMRKLGEHMDKLTEHEWWNEKWLKFVSRWWS